MLTNIIIHLYNPIYVGMAFRSTIEGTVGIRAKLIDNNSNITAPTRLKLLNHNNSGSTGNLHNSTGAGRSSPQSSQRTNPAAATIGGNGMNGTGIDNMDGTSENGGVINQSLQIIIAATSENLHEIEVLSSPSFSSRGHFNPITPSAQARRRSFTELKDGTNSNANSSKSIASMISTGHNYDLSHGMDRTSSGKTLHNGSNSAGGGGFSWLELPKLLVKVMEGEITVGSTSDCALEVVITLPTHIASSLTSSQSTAGARTSGVRKDSTKTLGQGNAGSGDLTIPNSIPLDALQALESLVTPRLPNCDASPAGGGSGEGRGGRGSDPETRMKPSRSIESGINMITPQENPELQANRLSVRHMRVLLVDDNKTAIKLRMRTLQACIRGSSNTTLSNHVIIAYTGEEAIEICEKDQGRFDLVIIGFRFDGAGGIMGGPEVIDKMRKTIKMSTTVIIGCSAPDEPSSYSLLMEAGADTVWSPSAMPTPEAALTEIALTRIKRLGSQGQMASQLPGCKRLLLVDDSAVNTKHFVRRLKLTLPASWLIRTRNDLEKVMQKILDKTSYYDVIITG